MSGHKYFYAVLVTRIRIRIQSKLRIRFDGDSCYCEHTGMTFTGQKKPRYAICQVSELKNTCALYAESEVSEEKDYCAF